MFVERIRQALQPTFYWMEDLQVQPQALIGLSFACRLQRTVKGRKRSMLRKGPKGRGRK